MVLGLLILLSACGGQSKEESIGPAASEWDNIQTAINTMMADNAMATVTAGASHSFITTNFDFGAGINLSAYMRADATIYCYTWADSGKILTQTLSVGSPSTYP